MSKGVARRLILGGAPAVALAPAPEPMRMEGERRHRAGPEEKSRAVPLPEEVEVEADAKEREGYAVRQVQTAGGETFPEREQRRRDFHRERRREAYARVTR